MAPQSYDASHVRGYGTADGKQLHSYVLALRRVLRSSRLMPIRTWSSKERKAPSRERPSLWVGKSSSASIAR